MSIWYTLVNFTRRERVSFAAICGMQKSQILFNSAGVGSVVTTAYMLKHFGDDISFVPDDLKFRGKSPEELDLEAFTDVTESIIKELVDGGV